MGASSGVPKPAGISASASRNFSLRSWRARYLSVSSLNTTVTTLRPKREMERSSNTPGMPRTAISTGAVTNCSTSVVDKEGQMVSTWAWLLVMSGMASMGRREKDQMPARAMTRVMPPTSNLCWRENLIMGSNMMQPMVFLQWAPLHACLAGV